MSTETNPDIMLVLGILLNADARESEKRGIEPGDQRLPQPEAQQNRGKGKDKHEAVQLSAPWTRYRKIVPCLFVHKP